MFVKTLPVLLLLIFIPAAGFSAERIAVGDPIERVYNTLGTPTLEYPLNGNLIQQYEECTIVCRDGVVCSAVYRQPAKDKVAEKAEEEKSPPSVSEVLTRAEQGDPEAQYLLAYSLQLGEVVEQDYAKAVEWYTKAALQGHMPAQHNLGWLYMRGKGVAQNYQEAYVWAILAADNGNDTLINAMHEKLTQEQRQAAELRAQQILSGADREPSDESRPVSTPAPDVMDAPDSSQQ